MLKAIGFAIIRFFAFFVPTDKRRITVLFFGYSGSNLTPIIHELTTNPDYSSYKIDIIYEGEWASDKVLARNASGSGRLRFFFHKFWSIARSRLVLSTHGVHHLKARTTYFDLWHGIPLKALYLMDKNTPEAKPEKPQWQDDIFLSTSTLFSSLMNACYGLSGAAYKILGYPRNDYLYSSAGRALLDSLLDTQAFAKVILFVPTYRDYAAAYQGAFPLADFDEKRFDQFLAAHNFCLITKRHREDSETEVLSGGLTNTFSLSSETFDNLQTDLYETLNGVDLLITDYSSIYFDYLLLDRPMVFIPTDLETYEQKRGFVIAPYEFWTPGPKCCTQADLEREILKSLVEPSYYASARKTIRDLFHDHQDGAATERVMATIREIME